MDEERSPTALSAGNDVLDGADGGDGAAFELSWRELVRGRSGVRARQRISECATPAAVADAAARANALGGEFRLVTDGSDGPIYVTAEALRRWAGRGGMDGPEPVPDPSGAQSWRMRRSAPLRWMVCGPRFHAPSSAD